MTVAVVIMQAMQKEWQKKAAEAMQLNHDHRLAMEAQQKVVEVCWSSFDWVHLGSTKPFLPRVCFILAIFAFESTIQSGGMRNVLRHAFTV